MECQMVLLGEGKCPQVATEKLGDCYCCMDHYLKGMMLFARINGYPVPRETVDPEKFNDESLHSGTAADHDIRSTMPSSSDTDAKE